MIDKSLLWILFENFVYAIRFFDINNLIMYDCSKIFYTKNLILSYPMFEPTQDYSSDKKTFHKTHKQWQISSESPQKIRWLNLGYTSSKL